MDDDIPRTREAVLARIDSANAAIDEALAGLSDDQLLAPAPDDGWSVRDILAHISADQRWLTAQLEAYQRGQPPTPEECYGDVTPPGPGYDMSTQDGRNAWQYAQHRDVPLAEVWERFARYRAAVEDAIRRVPAEAFQQPFALAMHSYCGRLQPAADGDQLVAPLWRWVQGNTWHHVEDHAAGIRERFSPQ